MATQINLIGNTTHIVKGSDTWVYPMDVLSYTLNNSLLAIFAKGVWIMSDASNDIQDIDGSTLANDTLLHAYLGQFIGASDLSRASNATLTSVTSVATTDTLLLAANEHRVKVFIYNNSTATLYVKYGTGASPTSFAQTRIAAGTLEPIVGYTGLLHFYHSALNGTIEVTEIHV